MFYDRDWEGVSIQEFIFQLNEYIIWYREKKNQDVIGWNQSNGIQTKSRTSVNWSKNPSAPPNRDFLKSQGP